MDATQGPDQFGNMLNCEGLVICTCGCKYYEHDKCVDCGRSAEENLKLPWNDLSDEIKAQEALDAYHEDQRRKEVAADIRSGLQRIIQQEVTA
tara:strand:+ start:283 stop:561 length:279 start_codon:yes stop_codon:yes gene_type:complete